MQNPTDTIHMAFGTISTLKVLAKALCSIDGFDPKPSLECLKEMAELSRGDGFPLQVIPMQAVIDVFEDALNGHDPKQRN